jgi:replicative superfamily II helicase
MAGDSIIAYCRRRGWPSALASAWRRRGMLRWTALQSIALAAGADCAESGDWLVSAPTSAGKSLVAEVAILDCLFRGEQAVWLVPTR